jgi:hypothetical protein
VKYALFDTLRGIRKDTAEKAGIPVYMVFTNEQLAAMVKKPPKSVKDLLAIPGVGEARVNSTANPSYRTGTTIWASGWCAPSSAAVRLRNKPLLPWKRAAR